MSIDLLLYILALILALLAAFKVPEGAVSWGWLAVALLILSVIV